jgi:hypothetical protein
VTSKKANVKHRDRAHAVLSASGSKRWLSCPGSIRLSEGLPEPEESEASKEGTKAHECLEFLLKNRGTQKQQKAAREMARSNYPEEMVDHCIDAYDYIKARIDLAGSDADVLIETEVDLSFVKEGMFGTLDVAIVQFFDKLTIIDFKYGHEAVEAEENSQLLYYALGIADRYNYHFSTVETVIVQPRAWHHSGNTVRTWTCDIGTLRRWHEIFAKGVKRTQKKNASLHAGDWCRYCPAVVKCPEVSKHALAQAKVVFDDKSLAIERLPIPDIIKPDDMARALTAVSKLKTWIKNVEEEAQRMMLRGRKVPGYKLVRGRGQRSWRDTMRAEVMFKKKLGSAAFTEPALLSPAQMEAKLKKLYPETWKKLLDRHTLRTEGSLLVAPERDKRPAVDPFEGFQDAEDDVARNDDFVLDFDVEGK